VISDGAGGTPPAAAMPDDVRVEDLRETGRPLGLSDQVIVRDLVGSSEVGSSDADRLRLVAAAEPARAIGSRTPPGQFVRLVRGRLWG
jgi:hypothetical protein